MQKTCPNCKSSLESDAIICIDCGCNLNTGVLLAKKVERSGQQVESDLERSLRTSRERSEGKRYIAQHVFLAFCVGVIGPMLHESFSDNDYSLSVWYSYVALELAIPSFLLGFYFAPTAKFPFRGFVGLCIGFLLGTQIINAWFGPGFRFLLPLIFPTICEILGIVVGKIVERQKENSKAKADMR